jgi:uncharacterized protein YndB with AHSA1/START domain
MVTLRELIVERIFYAVTEDELLEEFMVARGDLEHLADVDLFELYEDVLFYVQ